MARPMAPASPDHAKRVDDAIHHLILARESLKIAGATMALEKVRLALSSAYGARRHVERRAFARLPGDE